MDPVLFTIEQIGGAWYRMRCCFPPGGVHLQTPSPPEYISDKPFLRRAIVSRLGRSGEKCGQVSTE